MIEGQRLERISGFPIQNDHAQICSSGTLDRAPHAFPFNHLVTHPQPRGIGNSNRMTLQIQGHFQNIPSGSGLLRGDGHIPSGQRIEQGGLAGIRNTQQGHEISVAQSLTPATIRKLSLDLLNEFPKASRHGLEDLVRRIPFIGKVHLRFPMGQKSDQPIPPILNLVAQGPFRLADGLTSLRLRLGMNEIVNSFRLGQIQFAVKNGPPGEFSRFRRTQSGHGTQRPHDPIDRPPAAMSLDLGTVFTGKTRWSRKPQDQALIEKISR